MTKTDFNTKYGRVAMPTPFAGGSNATKATIYDAGTGGDFNFADGFASPYSAPKSNNGKFVTRGEINCLGNVATANEFNHMCGGLNIFDVEFAKKIGGYPQDAVLDILVGTQLYKIQSLQDNNLVNPYGVSSSPVVGGSVDGVWWRYLNQDNAIDNGDLFVGKFSRNAIYTGFTTQSTNGVIVKVEMSECFEVVSGFISPRSGLLYMEDVNLTYKPVGEQAVSASAEWKIILGICLMYKDVGTDPSGLTNIAEPTYDNLNGWQQLAGAGGNTKGIYRPAGTGDPTTNWSVSSSIPVVQSGHYIAIGVCFGFPSYSTAGSFRYGGVGSGPDGTDPLSFNLYIR